MCSSSLGSTCAAFPRACVGFSQRDCHCHPCGLDLARVKAVCLTWTQLVECGCWSSQNICSWLPLPTCWLLIWTCCFALRSLTVVVGSACLDLSQQCYLLWSLSGDGSVLLTFKTPLCFGSLSLTVPMCHVAVCMPRYLELWNLCSLWSVFYLRRLPVVLCFSIGMSLWWFKTSFRSPSWWGFAC